MVPNGSVENDRPSDYKYGRGPIFFKYFFLAFLHRLKPYTYVYNLYVHDLSLLFSDVFFFSTSRRVLAALLHVLEAFKSADRIIMIIITIGRYYLCT